MELAAALGEPVEVLGPIGDARGRASSRLEIRTPTRHLVVKRSGEVAREAAFYREVAPTSGLRLPRLHHADAEQLVLDFVDGRPGEVLEGCPLGEIPAVAEQIAWLHALDRRPDFVSGRWNREPEAKAARVEACLPDFRAAVPDSPVHARLDGLAARARDAIARLDRLPHALIHADLHVENLIFTEEGPVVLDWQTVSWGPPAVDVARFLVEGTGPHPDFARLAGDPPGIEEALDVLLADIVCSAWFRRERDEATRALIAHDLASWEAVRGFV